MAVSKVKIEIEEHEDHPPLSNFLYFIFFLFGYIRHQPLYPDPRDSQFQSQGQLRP